MALWKMSNLKTLAAAFAAAALLTLPLSAFAAYAQLKPPAGWSMPTSIGTSGTFKTGPASNQNSYKGSTVLTNAALEIGGQSVQVPVSMRIAANAATVAATFAFGNPLLFATLAVGSAAYQYYNQQGLSADYGIWVTRDPNGCSVAPCYEYLVETQPWYSSGPTAAAAFIQQRNASGAYYKDVYTLVFADNTKLTYAWKRDGQVITAGTDLSYSTRLVPPSPPSVTPVQLPKFHEIMDPIPVPYGVPQLLPDVDFPVEQPAINPSPLDIPDTFPSPASPPASKPLWVPTGDPVKNPTVTNPDGTPKPDTWTQPGKNIKPAGSPTDPWRVDVTDAPKTKNDSSPNTDTPIPTTTTPTPTDFQTCGLPGKPKCLIDETGTPTLDPKKLELDKATLEPAASAQRDKVTSPGDKNSIFQPFSQFFSLPPLATCTPVVMPSFAGQQIASMDVCPGAEWLRGLMGFVWAVAGFLFVFRTVQDVI